jgi:2-polyprenyl-3-methyl-5-hydroxy-6-metoxy-1,4-benzoquinol methylase
MVLVHVADPDVALMRMAASLEPGGWLVVEDIELPVGTFDDVAAKAEFRLKTAAALRQVTAAAGVDGRLAATLARRLRSQRLAHVGPGPCLLSALHRRRSAVTFVGCAVIQAF